MNLRTFWLLAFALVSLIIFSFIACGDDDDDSDDAHANDDVNDDSSDDDDDTTDGDDDSSAASRMMGINLWPSETGDESSAFEIGRSAGINGTMIGYSWTEVEVEPGVFDYTEIDNANSIYASGDVKIILMLNPVETDWRSVPFDLEAVAFDDPEMIERFKQLLTNVLDRLPDLDIDAIIFGNEVDGYIGDNNQWDAYKSFYEAVGAHAKALRPGIKIGVEGMFAGMMNDYPEEMKELNLSSDIFALTYYPTREVPGHLGFPDTSVIAEDIAALTSSYTGKPIYLIEVGYSSSPLLDSSEEEQEEFVREIFRIWDDYASRIEFLSFFMLHDFSPDYIDPLLEALELTEHPYYEEIRAAFLTLGLRTSLGVDKLAFPTLIQEAKKRGWE